MNIRQARATDFAGILKIAENIMSSLENYAAFNWPRGQLLVELGQVTTLAADSEGSVHGFLCYRDLPDFFEISVLATDPGHQRTGLQTKLIQYLQDLAAKQRKDILLEVHSENLGAIRLYQKLGFASIHSRQNYYSDGAQAVVMKWESNKAGC